MPNDISHLGVSRNPHPAGGGINFDVSELSMCSSCEAGCVASCSAGGDSGNSVRIMYMKNTTCPIAAVIARMPRGNIKTHKPVKYAPVRVRKVKQSANEAKPIKEQRPPLKLPN